MKKFLKVICCLFIFTMCFSLVGCNTKDENNKVYNLTLIVGGETWMEVKCSELDKLPTPSKEFCDFEGWYLNGENVEDLNLDVLEASFNLEAKFTLKSNYQCIKMLSSSMVPTIENNEYVLVDRTVENYGIGDIVAYQKSGSNIIVIHRIVEISGETYITKGDVNSENGNAISKSDIIGKMVYVIGETLPSDVIG